MEDDPRWWLPADVILHEGDAGRQDHSGQQLRFFDVRLDSSILVESVQPLSVGALKRLGGAASPERVRQLMSAGSGDASVVYSEPSWWETGPGPNNPLTIIADIVEDMIKGATQAIDWQQAAQDWLEKQKQKPPQ